VVSQETHLFTATVRDNLLLARPEASLEELQEACRVARIHTFIETLPDGYDTWLGEAGATLSGGQARRLAIARAVLKDAPVLILDEPTEGLDATTAREVMTTLDEVARDKSVILVTHRNLLDGRFGETRELRNGLLI
jgi:ATP-binding cassette subfamily C protein CydC